MKNIDNITGLFDRGNGLFAFEDTHNPRLTNNEVAVMVGKTVGKRVQHIARSPYIGKTVHILQLTSLFDRDMDRKKQKLVEKFNS